MKALKIGVGYRFERLVVIKEAEKSKHGRRRFLMLCDCGLETTVDLHQLTRGRTKSCGCYGRDFHRNRLFIPDRKAVALHSLFIQRRAQAKKKNQDWSLTKEQFENITSLPCFYTGRNPYRVHRTTGGAEYVYNGIDRADNTKGYTLDNCVPCCWEINDFKGALNKDNFLDLIEEIHKHQTEII